MLEAALNTVSIGYEGANKYCPFSADDCAYAGHWIGPRPVLCKIKLRFRRFGYGTGQITGLNVYYI